MRWGSFVLGMVASTAAAVLAIPVRPVGCFLAPEGEGTVVLSVVEAVEPGTLLSEDDLMYLAWPAGSAPQVELSDIDTLPWVADRPLVPGQPLLPHHVTAPVTSTIHVPDDVSLRRVVVDDFSGLAAFLSMTSEVDLVDLTPNLPRTVQGLVVLDIEPVGDRVAYTLGVQDFQLPLFDEVVARGAVAVVSRTCGDWDTWWSSSDILEPWRAATFVRWCHKVDGRSVDVSGHPCDGAATP